jgi:hypothetical protein
MSICSETRARPHRAGGARARVLVLGADCLDLDVLAVEGDGIRRHGRGDDRSEVVSDRVAREHGGSEVRLVGHAIASR